MRRTPIGHRGAVFAALAAALAGCGGESDKAESPLSPDTRFQTYAMAHPGGSAAVGSIALGAAQAEEVARLSREWAVAALDGGSTAYLNNDWTLPPLHFARQAVVAAAARGQTLAELGQAVTLPSADTVAAALAQGVARSISALAEGRFQARFLSVATAEAAPATWSSLALRPLSPSQLSADGNTRLQIDDSVAIQTDWHQPAAARGVWDSPSGRVELAVVRLRGPLLRHEGADYSATGLPMPGAGWLVQITPATHGPSWAGVALRGALAEVTAAIASRPAAAATQTDGELVLPLMRLDAPQDRGSLAGMGLAQDELNADLRGLDGGGTYLKPSPLVGSLAISPTALDASGALSTRFIHSPRNASGGSGGGVIVTRVDPVVISPVPLPACPADAVELKPFHLAVIQANGNVSLLARVAQVSGSRCQ